LDVDRARHAVGERRDVGRTTDLVEIAGAAQLLFERDEVDGVATLAEGHHPIEDAAMRVAEEIARVDQLRRVVERFVADEDRAEDGFFSVEAVRQRAFGSDNVGHESTRSSGQVQSLRSAESGSRPTGDRLLDEGRTGYSIAGEIENCRSARLRLDLRLLRDDLHVELRG